MNLSLGTLAGGVGAGFNRYDTARRADERQDQAYSLQDRRMSMAEDEVGRQGKARQLGQALVMAVRSGDPTAEAQAFEALAAEVPPDKLAALQDARVKLTEKSQSLSLEARARLAGQGVAYNQETDTFGRDPSLADPPTPYQQLEAQTETGSHWDPNTNAWRQDPTFTPTVKAGKPAYTRKDLVSQAEKELSDIRDTAGTWLENEFSGARKGFSGRYDMAKLQEFYPDLARQIQQTQASGGSIKKAVYRYAREQAKSKLELDVEDGFFDPDPEDVEQPEPEPETVPESDGPIEGPAFQGGQLAPAPPVVQAPMALPTLAEPPMRGGKAPQSLGLIDMLRTPEVQKALTLTKRQVQTYPPGPEEVQSYIQRAQADVAAGKPVEVVIDAFRRAGLHPTAVDQIQKALTQ